jgi:hypothetical protein
MSIHFSNITQRKSITTLPPQWMARRVDSKGCGFSHAGMRKELLLVGALAALSLPALVWAKGVETGVKRAQMLDFSGRTAAETIEVGGRAATPVLRLPNIENAMLSSFADRAAVTEAGAMDVVPRYAAQLLKGSAFGGGEGFVRMPRVFLPAWMRPGHAQFAGQLMPVGLPSIGNCGPRDYVPSGMLRARGEERRRILYPLVVQSACRYGIPVGLFDAMIIQESRYNPSAVSPKGAFGLGQLMPGTAADLRVNPYMISDNLEGAAKYLSLHLREFNDPVLALAAYNAGPGRVRVSRAVPRIYETQDYVQKIMWNWRTLEVAAQRF